MARGTGRASGTCDDRLVALAVVKRPADGDSGWEPFLDREGVWKVSHFELIALAAFIVAAVIFTVSIGLLLMLALTLYRERQMAAGNQ